MAEICTRLFDFAYHQLATNPQQKCFNTKAGNQWISTSTQSYIDQANSISRALLRLGVKPNDKIAVVTSTNRVEWSILDVAVLQIGAVNVPLYPTISASDFDRDGDIDLVPSSGNVRVTGTIRATGDVLAGTVSLVNHLTTNVQPGGGLSGVPAQ